MSDSALEKRLRQISNLVTERAADTASTTTPTQSRRQKERVRAAVSSYYLALDELNHVFQDINSTSALGYFDEAEANLIRQAASSLSDARRAIRKLSAGHEWLRKK